MTTPRLAVVRGATPVEYDLLGEVVTIGRDWDNTIPFPAASGVSAHHARVLARIGLFWLEDLNSAHGTFLHLPGGERFRLKPGEPVLLVNGARIGLADAVILEARGLVASQDEATRWALARLQAFTSACQDQIARLPLQERQDVQARLRQLEEVVRQAGGEADLVRVVAEQLDALTRTTGCPSPDAGLPPMAEDLPEPDSPYRMPSLNNLFLSHLQQLAGQAKKDRL